MDMVGSSRASGTFRTYQSYISQWRHWAADTHVNPNMPSAPQVGVFLGHINSQAQSASVVSLAHAALVWFFNLLHLVPNPAHSFFCHSIVDSAKKVKLMNVNRKEPFTVAHIHSIISQFGSATNSFSERRLVALIVLLFTVFLRIHEALVLQVRHIKFQPSSMLVHVSASKTDRFRQGSDVAIAATNSIYCPVTLLRDYMDFAGISGLPQAYLFPALRWDHLHREVRPIVTRSATYNTVRADLQNVLRYLQLSPMLYGFHSCRSGGATAAIHSGHSSRMVMRHGRWLTHSAFSRYIDDSALDRATVSRLL